MEVPQELYAKWRNNTSSPVYKKNWFHSFVELCFLLFSVCRWLSGDKLKINFQSSYALSLQVKLECRRPWKERSNLNFDGMESNRCWPTRLRTFTTAESCFPLFEWRRSRKLWKKIISATPFAFRARTSCSLVSYFLREGRHNNYFKFIVKVAKMCVPCQRSKECTRIHGTFYLMLSICMSWQQLSVRDTFVVLNAYC